jgi:hypothetical protein
MCRDSDGLRAGRPGFDSRQCMIFLFSIAYRPTLGPTQPPIQWVPGALSAGVKRPGREAYHSPLSSAEAKNTWSNTSTPPYVFMAQGLIKYLDKFPPPLYGAADLDPSYEVP